MLASVTTTELMQVCIEAANDIIQAITRMSSPESTSIGVGCAGLEGNRNHREHNLSVCHLE